MFQEQFESFEEDLNPIDSVEDVLAAQNWTFQRVSEDELVVEVAGKHGRYRLFFIWQENMCALQFGCHYDMIICENNMNKARGAIMSINERLWLGHFDLPAETGTPIFRYTCMLRGPGLAAAAEVIEDMVDISLVQCERYAPVFKLMTEPATGVDSRGLSLALMETVGES